MTYIIENENRSLTQLLEQIKDQAARTADYLSPTTDLQFETVKSDDAPNRSRIVIEARQGMPTTCLQVNDVAFDQIAQRADLPAKTARRLRDDYPDVLDHAIRRIWDQEPEMRMVRAFMNHGNYTSVETGTARAFVSDRFKTFDNVHLLEAALPQLMESDAQWKIVNGTVTDKRMYLQLKSEVITADAAARAANPSQNVHIMRPTEYTRDFGNGVNRTVGDAMALGIRISNSEVGHGSISINQLVWTLACLNGMQTENLFRKAHLGAKAQDQEFASLLKQDTIDASNRALSLQMRDIVEGFASRDSFEQVIDKMRNAHENVVEATPQDAVEKLGTVLKLTKSETSSVLDGLLDTLQQSGYTGKPVSQATMVNAVTAVQHKVDADNVGDWQRLGAKVLNMPQREWEYVARAA